MMNNYKTFEELKEELGDKFEEYMYQANIELLTKIDRAIEILKDGLLQLDTRPREQVYSEQYLENAIEELGGKNESKHDGKDTKC